MSCLLLYGVPVLDRVQEGNPSIVVANVDAFSGNDAMLEQSASMWDADVVVLIEKRIENIPSMKRVADDFAEKVPRPSHHMAIYCAPEQMCAAYVSPQVDLKRWRCRTALPVSRALLGFVHAPPPIPYDTTGMAPYLDELARHVQMDG